LGTGWPLLETDTLGMTGGTEGLFRSSSQLQLW